jgi:S-DNA-T family DNA segregation ATPase FtsK/SpoIIIE
MGFPVHLVAVDELSYLFARAGTLPQQKEFNAATATSWPAARPGIVGIEATQRPSADIIPTSLRDLFGFLWAFHCITEASSDTILGRAGRPWLRRAPPRLRPARHH